MKKVLTTIIAAIVFVLSVNAQDDAQALIKQKSDSLSMIFGQAYGGSIAMLYDRQGGMSKEDFLAGFNSVMSVDTTRSSYLEGVDVAMGFLKTIDEMSRKQGIKMNRDLFVQAFVGQLLSDTPLSQDSVMALNQQLQDGVQATAELVQANDPIVKAGEAYAAQALATDPDFHRSESGLVYKVLAAGEGENFTATDRVRLNYKGSHVDGSVFDQSTDTITLGVSQVVPGFSEALKMMRPGSKLIAIIPGNLGYGKRGAGNGLIKPNETLVFEIETYGLEAPAAPRQQSSPSQGGVSSDRRHASLDPSVRTVAPPRGPKRGGK